MPFYEYECDVCKHKFEKFQGIKEEPLMLCPKCDKKMLRRIFGVPALIFKGSGWTPKHYG